MSRTPVFESLEGRRLLYAPFEGDGLGAVVIPQLSVVPPAESVDPLPAGAPNLTAVRALVVDGGNMPLADVVIGQRVYVRFEYTTTDLTAGDGYVVRFRMDGVPVDSSVIQGLSGSGVEMYWAAGGWVATPGPHTIEVTADGAASVAEVNEGDNVASANFTSVAPASLPAKFVLPLAGAQSVDWSIVNYLDVDPTGGGADYRGGDFQYNGHEGVDFIPPNFARMDAGVPIVAAAAGVVNYVLDGNYDHQTVGLPSNVPNYVIIDHGGGWQTYYLHLAANSIDVKIGDTVTAGQMIGLAGSSGYSNVVHLHFEVHYRGCPVETYALPGSYWFAPLPYQGDLPTRVLDGGVSDYAIWPDTYERPSDATVFQVGRSEDAWFWYLITNEVAGQQYVNKFYRPGGVLAYTAVGTATEANRLIPRAATLNSAAWSQFTGTWEAAVEVNGVELARRPFVVTGGAGAGAMKVVQGSTYLLSGRITPISFGSAAMGAIGAFVSFTIQNHGSGTLSTGDFTLPPGFSFGAQPPASVAPGASATFSVRLNTATAGRKFGSLRFTSSDPNEPAFSCLLSGTVTNAPAGTPQLSTPDPPGVPYRPGEGAFAVAPLAVLSDDSPNLFGGRMIVRLWGIAVPADQLAIAPAGDGPGQINRVGDAVFFGGAPIGTVVASGSGTLRVDFDAGAVSPAAAQALVRAVTFSAGDGAPTSPRYVTIEVIDNAGLSVVSAPRTIGFDLYEHPRVTGSEFVYDAAAHRLAISFDADLAGSAVPQNLILRNLTTGATIAAGDMAVAYDSATDTATFTFPGLAGGRLPNGRYSARFDLAATVDDRGVPFFGDPSVSFFFLAGDATRDGAVDFNDLVALAQHYNGAGNDWAGGDFTGDGAVGFDDLVVLAQNYNTSLPPLPSVRVKGDSVLRSGTAAYRPPAPAPAAPFARSRAAVRRTAFRA